MAQELVQALAGSSIDSHVGTRKLDLLKMWIAEVLAHTFTGSSAGSSILQLKCWLKRWQYYPPALMGHHGHGAIVIVFVTSSFVQCALSYCQMRPTQGFKQVKNNFVLSLCPYSTPMASKST